jgi:site-specific DNA recombinase
MQKMIKVFLYIRVSTDEQADTGYSQRSQDEMLTKYCELNNMLVVEKYYEDHSAKNFNRPQFAKLLLQLKKHRGIAELVLFTKWDRFSRNAGDAYQMINTLNKLGVDPQAVEQPLNLEIPENKMMLAFYLAAPEVENDRRALNVFNGMRRAKKEGRYMGKAPIGYSNKIDSSGRKFIAANDKAPLVVWIFETLATGNFSAESVFTQAKAMGLLCKKNTYWNLLRNTGYCGLIKIKAYKTEEEQLLQGTHEAIISKELFFEVQDILDGKKKKQRTKITVDDRFPLRGFLTCPDCNKLLTASSSKGRKQYYHYYHCTSACGVRFKAEIINDKIVEELQKWKPNAAVAVLYKMILKDVYEQLQKQQLKELVFIKGEMKAAADRQNKALELLMQNVMEADDYRKVKKGCEQTIMLLEEKMASFATARDLQPLIDKALSVLENVDAVYMNSNTLGKRSLIGSMFPDKLQFDGEHYRTTRINEAVRIIYNLGAAFSKIKMAQVVQLSDLCHEVNPLVQFSNLFYSDLQKIAALAA